MSLNTLANYAEILGAATIVTGLLIGWFQVRYYRAQQRNSVAINLMQTFYSGELMKAIAILQPLPDGVSLDELQAKGNEYVQAAITVSVSFETMAWAVFKRMATMDMVLDLAGGIIITMGRKLQKFTEDMRIVQQQPSWAEWFEWLANQANKRKSMVEPAHIRYRDWKK
jgi:hypothetical protein